MKSILSPKLPITVRVAAFFIFMLPATLFAQGHTYQTSFQNARVLLNEKLYDQALVQAKWAIASDNSQWGGYYVAGTALVGLQRQGEAITFFQAALARAPEQAKPIINSAIASCRQISANESQAPPPATYSPPQFASSSQSGMVVAPRQSGTQPLAPQPGQEAEFPVLHNHHLSFGPGILTVGQTISFSETQSGPIIRDETTFNSKHTFAVPAQQVRFSYEPSGLGFVPDAQDERLWNEVSADPKHGRPLMRYLRLEVAGKKWDFLAPEPTLSAIEESLSRAQRP